MPRSYQAIASVRAITDEDLVMMKLLTMVTDWALNSLLRIMMGLSFGQEYPVHGPALRLPHLWDR